MTVCGLGGIARFAADTVITVRTLAVAGRVDASTTGIEMWVWAREK